MTQAAADDEHGKTAIDVPKKNASAVKNNTENAIPTGSLNSNPPTNNMSNISSDAKINNKIATGSFFGKVKEVLSNIFSSIRNGLRRAFYWVKKKFSPRTDDSEI